MERLKFTTMVLGPIPAYRLEQHQITQTLRSHSSDTVQAILTGKLKVGDQMEVTLDGKWVGLAEFVIVDAITWVKIDLGDARRGGFDTVADLEEALQRAGYRFKPLSAYNFYRIQFSWLLQEA